LTGLRLLLLAAALGPWVSARAAPPPAPPPAAASGDRSAEAKAAYKRGADLYRAGRYSAAIAEFQAADTLKPSPALHYNMGQAWEKLGDLPAALAAYARYLQLDPRAPNREAVERTVRSLEAKVATASPETPRLDPVQGPVPVPPATSLTANSPPPPLEATRPDPAPQPVERKNWLGPIIAGGLGVVAASAGVIMGVQARNAQNALLAGGNDRQQADALVSKAKSDATAANVLYGVAGAAVLTGGVLAIAF
jgi:tetratricopeptide (TPR) repeat protein